MTVGLLGGRAGCSPTWVHVDEHPLLVTTVDKVVTAAAVGSGTALRIRNGSATSVGDSAVVVLDGRQGAFGTGSNGAMAVRWVLLDIFTDGQKITP